MPETPKEKEVEQEVEPETDDRSKWSVDQKERGYYYDDAHGYEEFDPDTEEEDD